MSDVKRVYSLDARSWRTPASAYPEARHGGARIDRHAYSPGLYNFHGATAPDGQCYEYYRITRPLTVTTLAVGDDTVMVDDPLHWSVIKDHAAAYHGDVLCAGLGLGLIAHALADNPGVDRITLVERDPDVLALVGPLVGRLPVRVAHADWYDYRHDRRPDGVFFDLFVGETDGMLWEAVGEAIAIRDRFPGTAVLRILGFPIELVEGLGPVWRQLASRTNRKEGDA